MKLKTPAAVLSRGMAAFFSNVENRDATFGEFSRRDEYGIANTNTSINLRNLLFYDG